MTKWSSQPFCNSWLRQEADLPPKHRSTLTYYMLPPLELQLVLDSIHQFENHTKCGRARTVAIQKLGLRDGTIGLSVEDLKEMSS